VVSITGNYHQLIPDTWCQWDSSASFAYASEGTPNVELPSFGGVSSVRGFRADATQGRLSWSLQNEIWVPLRYQMGFPDSIDAFIRRNLYFAPFVDVGGVNQSTGELNGLEAGAGLGIRATYNSLTFRLDYGQSLKNVNSKYGGTTFFFSVTCRPSF